MPTVVKRKKPVVKQFRAFTRKLALLAEGGAPATRVELIRCGEFFGYGFDSAPFEVTEEMLKSFVQNFNDNIRGVDLAIDYAHNNQSIAAGWIKALTYDQSTKSLWADVEWTPAGKKVLEDKEFRYLSAEFTTDYEDNETRALHGPTLLGAGLTNRPFVKGMQPITSLSEDKAAATGNGVMAMTPEEMTAAIQAMQAQMEKLMAGGMPVPSAPPAPKAPVDNIEDDPEDEEEDLSNGGQDTDDQKDGNGDNPPPPKGGDDGSAPPKNLKKPLAKAGDKPAPKDGGGDKSNEGESQMTDAEKKQMEALQAQLDAANAKIAEHDKQKALSEKKGQFDKMLSDGKAVEAQREAFMAGDMVKFAELAKPVKEKRLSDASSDAGGEDEGAGEKDPQDEIKKLAEKLVDEKKVKTLSEGYSAVLNDPKHADLRKRYEAASYNVGTQTKGQA